MVFIMENNFVEYVKIKLDNYEKLKKDSNILTKINDNIDCVYYDKNGNIISYFWEISTDSNTKRKLMINFEGLLSSLGYEVNNYDNIIIDNLPKNNNRLEL